MTTTQQIFLEKVAAKIIKTLYMAHVVIVKAIGICNNSPQYEGKHTERVLSLTLGVSVRLILSLTQQNIRGENIFQKVCYKPSISARLVLL